jgi:hypothetical protein
MEISPAYVDVILETFEKSLQIQELYRVANILSVGCDVIIEFELVT